MKDLRRPGQCGSVGWCVILETEGLQVQSLVRAQTRRQPIYVSLSNQCQCLSLCCVGVSLSPTPSLPLALKKNKRKKKELRKQAWQCSRQKKSVMKGRDQGKTRNLRSQSWEWAVSSKRWGQRNNRHQIIQNLVGHYQDFSFYFTQSRKLLEGFEHDMTWL